MNFFICYMAPIFPIKAILLQPYNHHQVMHNDWAPAPNKPLAESTFG